MTRLTLKRTLFLIPVLLVTTVASAQELEQANELAPLPLTSATDQLLLLTETVVPPPAPPSTEPSPQTQVPKVRRRLPIPESPQTPEELFYRDAVQKLGVDQHRFVHCELRSGKVRTGVIEFINDKGFRLKDGILLSQFISYADLKAAPRPVPAVGTRISQAFKWAGVVLVAIPLMPFAFLFWDGC